MSDLGLELDPEHEHRRRQRRRGGLGCLAVLIAFAVLAGGAYFVFDSGAYGSMKPAGYLISPNWE